MSSVGPRLMIFCAIMLGAMGFWGHRAYLTYDRLEKLYSSLEKSHELEESAGALLASKSQSKNTLTSLRAEVEGLEPLERRAAWLQLLSDIENKSPSRWRSQIDFVQRYEREFRRHEKTKTSFLSDQLRLFVSTFIALVGLLILTSIWQLKAGVFRPLRALSRRMMDFLNDRYTYQFSVPATNEVGNLQATFNALAQRVLSNMEELTDLDRAKSEFLSIASHELRTPLTSIKGSLSLMKSGVVGDMNEMAQNLLNIAESETDRLIRLINELLDLAKIEAGKFNVHPAWHSLPQLVDKTFSSLQGLSKAADVKLTAVNLPSVEAQIDGDCIQQVLTNLLSNAIKFSPSGGTVDVHFEVNAEQQLVVEVTDHGRGIAPEDQALIFQKFRQATSVKNPLVKGTGLGLAIAKALVEEHGGQIGVRSSPGVGSTFYFSLPDWKYTLPDELNVNRSTTTGAAA